MIIHSVGKLLEDGRASQGKVDNRRSCIGECRFPQLSPNLDTLNAEFGKNCVHKAMMIVKDLRGGDVGGSTFARYLTSPQYGQICHLACSQASTYYMKSLYV